MWKTGNVFLYFISYFWSVNNALEELYSICTWFLREAFVKGYCTLQPWWLGHINGYSSDGDGDLHSLEDQTVWKNSQFFNHLFLFLQVLHKKIYYLSFLAKIPQMCHRLAVKTLYFIYHFFIQEQDVGADLYSCLFLPFEAEKLKVFGHLALMQN